jgi:protoheme IX farnesyltransferase
MNSTVEIPVQRDAGSTALALWQLTKPAITRMVLITMLCGALVAPQAIDVLRLCIALFGTSVIVAAANALNMYLERDSDAYMERTRDRPLPSGRLAPEVALWFGVVSSVAGIAGVTLWVNAISGLLGAIALLSYVLVYTPLKRVTPLALYVGAVPGALPPVIGWASVMGSVDIRALALFAILFAWQLPHFLAIAVFRQDEYQKARIVVLPSRVGLRATKWHIIATSAILLAITLAPPFIGLGGTLYLVIAAATGAVFLGYSALGLRADAGKRWARSLFFMSLPYLVVVFGALVISAA